MSSIAQANQIKQLEGQITLLRELVRMLAETQKKTNERLEALENRPKPGRPPKNG